MVRINLLATNCHDAKTPYNDLHGIEIQKPNKHKMPTGRDYWQENLDLKYQNQNCFKNSLKELEICPHLNT